MTQMQPDNILDYETKPVKKPNYFRLRGVIIWLCLLLIAFGFILMRWAGAHMLILISTAGLSAYSLSALVRLKWTDKLNNAFSILSFCWMVALLAGVFFNDGIPYNEKGLELFGAIFAAFFTGYYFVLGFLNSRKR